jgi:hypothetical protein
MSSPFYPQTDGKTERANRTRKETIRHYVGYIKDNLCAKLAYLEFAYKNVYNKTKGQTLLLLNYGQEQLEFSDLSLKEEPNIVLLAPALLNLLNRTCEDK